MDLVFYGWEAATLLFGDMRCDAFCFTEKPIISFLRGPCFLAKLGYFKQGWFCWFQCDIRCWCFLLPWEGNEPKKTQGLRKYHHHLSKRCHPPCHWRVMTNQITMRGGDVPDFLNFARKEVVSETTQLKVCIGLLLGLGGKICRKVGRWVGGWEGGLEKIFLKSLTWLDLLDAFFWGDFLV